MKNWRNSPYGHQQKQTPLFITSKPQALNCHTCRHIRVNWYIFKGFFFLVNQEKNHTFLHLCRFCSVYIILWFSPRLRLIFLSGHDSNTAQLQMRWFALTIVYRHHLDIFTKTSCLGLRIKECISVIRISSEASKLSAVSVFSDLTRWVMI